MKKLDEKSFGHGYVHKRLSRHLRPKLHKLIFVGGAPLPFDWNKGYDVEQDLNIKLPVKNQGESFSCGGQTGATMESVNEAALTGKFIERSAKDAYAHIFLRGGGTTSDRLINIMLRRGIATEALVSSYQNGNPPSEAFMINKGYETPEITADANATIDTTPVSIDFSNIDSIAQGVRDCKGAAIALLGRNGQTPGWLSSTPQPPEKDDGLWGHFVTALGAMAITPTEYQGLKDGIITREDLLQKYGS